MTDLDDLSGDAEQSILGAMMLSRDAVIDALDAGLAPEHFRRPAHHEVYEALCDAFSAVDGAVDPIVCAQHLEARGTLARVGGAPYLHTLIATHHSTANVGYYAEVLMKRHAREIARQAGVRLQQFAASATDSEDVDAMLDQARKELDHAAGLGRQRDAREFDRVVDDWLAQLGAPADPPLTTGVADLDDKLGGGFRPGQFVVVGARPGVGKSVIGLNFATAAALRGQGVLVASLEMSETELLERLFADQANVRLDSIRQPRLMESEDRRRLEMAADRVARLPMRVNEEPVQTLASIRADMRGLSRTKRGLRLVVVDYMQLMTPAESSARRQRSEIVGEFSRGLKVLAKEFGVTVVALAQLNRASTERAGGRPVLNDLRESGSIEQDADVVMLLHRDPDEPEGQDAIEVRIAKQRGGPTGAVDLLWVGPHQRVESRHRRGLRAV